MLVNEGDLFVGNSTPARMFWPLAHDRESSRHRLINILPDYLPNGLIISSNETDDLEPLAEIQSVL